MSHLPPILYNIAENHALIDEKSVIWNEDIPENRYGASLNEEKYTTYGTYFSSAGRFLSDNNFSVLLDALHIAKGIRTPLSSIEKITVFLVKHGAFYHPSMVLVDSFNEPAVRFVLNVAVSHEGRSIIRSEYDFFKNMPNKKIMKYVPDVYGFGDVETDNGSSLPMFIGQWFDDFHEFHLSHDGDEVKQIVWDSKGYFYLSSEQERELYHQAAMIMTGFYDLKDYKRITPWHHASGDFIVNCYEDKIALRLITVRGYKPLMENDGGVESMFNALFLFFIDLTLKMRLDRLDGIGSPVWAGENAVDGVVTGFFEGLRINKSIDFCGFSMDELFGRFLSGIDEDCFLNTLKGVSSAFHPMDSDLKIINDKLELHSKIIFEKCRKYI